MRIGILTLLALLAGCSTYVTPGGPAQPDDIAGPALADISSRRPTAPFPTRIAVVRVQSSDYNSLSAKPWARGRFSVVTAGEDLTDELLRRVQIWPSVAGAAAIDRELLPRRIGSLDDLRVAAAKAQADVILLYTLDTAFTMGGTHVDPLTAVPLNVLRDNDAQMVTTASGIFVDVRTGFIYGGAESKAGASALAASRFTTSSAVDRKRVEAEHDAFSLMLDDAGKTWAGIAQQNGH